MLLIIGKLEEDGLKRSFIEVRAETAGRKTSDVNTQWSNQNFYLTHQFLNFVKVLGDRGVSQLSISKGDTVGSAKFSV